MRKSNYDSMNWLHWSDIAKLVPVGITQWNDEVEDGTAPPFCYFGPRTKVVAEGQINIVIDVLNATSNGLSEFDLEVEEITKEAKQKFGTVPPWVHKRIRKTREVLKAPRVQVAKVREQPTSEAA